MIDAKSKDLHTPGLGQEMNNVKQVEVTVVNTLRDWESGDGVDFMKNIGIKTGDEILDFGCRVGHYSIPAALVAGKRGKVYAVDKHWYQLEELKRKARNLELRNIELIKTSGKADFAFVHSTVDVILLYDVLHYFERPERLHLYKECLGILNEEGFLSVYPKHTVEGGASGQFQGVHIADIIHEISKTNFQFFRKYCGLISHDDSLNQGCVLNFIKGRKQNNNIT